MICRCPRMYTILLLQHLCVFPPLAALLCTCVGYDVPVYAHTLNAIAYVEEVLGLALFIAILCLGLYLFFVHPTILADILTKLTPFMPH